MESPKLVPSQVCRRAVKSLHSAHALGHSSRNFSTPEKRVALSLSSSWVPLLFLPFSLWSLYFSHPNHSPWVTFLSLWRELSVTLWWLWTQNCKSRLCSACPCPRVSVCGLSSSPSASQAHANAALKKKKKSPSLPCTFWSSQRVSSFTQRAKPRLGVIFNSSVPYFLSQCSYLLSPLCSTCFLDVLWCNILAKFNSGPWSLEFNLVDIS